MTSFVWGVIFSLYALGYCFSDDKHRPGIMLCWASCCFGLGVWHYSEFNIMEVNLYGWYLEGSYFLYSIVDFCIASWLMWYGFRRLGQVVYLSSLLHAVALVAYSFNYIHYFAFYGYVMIGINLLLLGMLFRDSRGNDMAMERLGRAVALLPSKNTNLKDIRACNDAYNHALLSRHVKDV